MIVTPAGRWTSRIWLALGLLIYVFYSRHHSEFCKSKSEVRS